MTIQNKRLSRILLLAAALLLLPFLAMQITVEVNWSLSDFAIAALLLFGSGLLIEAVLRSLKRRIYRRIAIAAILILLVLVWAELAVGILGTPIAGS